MKWSLVLDFRCAHLDSKNNFPLKLLFDLPRQPLPIRALSLASLGFDLPCWAAWNHGGLLLLWAESSLILWGAMLCCRNPLWNWVLYFLCQSSLAWFVLSTSWQYSCVSTQDMVQWRIWQLSLAHSVGEMFTLLQVWYPNEPFYPPMNNSAWQSVWRASVKSTFCRGNVHIASGLVSQWTFLSTHEQFCLTVCLESFSQDVTLQLSLLSSKLEMNIRSCKRPCLAHLEETGDVTHKSGGVEWLISANLCLTVNHSSSLSSKKNNLSCCAMRTWFPHYFWKAVLSCR